MVEMERKLGILQHHDGVSGTTAATELHDQRPATRDRQPQEGTPRSRDR